MSKRRQFGRKRRYYTYSSPLTLEQIQFLRDSPNPPTFLREIIDERIAQEEDAGNISAMEERLTELRETASRLDIANPSRAKRVRDTEIRPLAKRIEKARARLEARQARERKAKAEEEREAAKAARQARYEEEKRKRKAELEAGERRMPELYEELNRLWKTKTPAASKKAKEVMQEIESLRERLIRLKERSFGIW